MNTIISGNKFQCLADLIVGRSEDEEHCDTCAFQNIATLRLNANFDNPPIVFCFGHCIDDFSQCIDAFQNPLILISHCSDFVVTDCESTRKILECRHVTLWFAQNIQDRTFFSLKLRFLPTGVANTDIWQSIYKYEKKKDVYLELTDKNIDIGATIPPLFSLPPEENIRRLAQYKFCICPEVDSHRLWEAYLVRAVPIALNSPFMQMVYSETHLPMVLLDSWDQLDVTKILPLYSHFDFSQGSDHLFMGAYAKKIIDKISSK